MTNIHDFLSQSCENYFAELKIILTFAFHIAG